MALILDDFKFEPRNPYKKMEIGFAEKYGDLHVNIKVGSTEITYSCLSIEYALPDLLEAFIDILWEYAERDKYFGYVRTRSRIKHDAESRGDVVWDLRHHSNSNMSSSFDILIRNNITIDDEYDMEYDYLRMPEYIAKVRGDVWLCHTVDTKHWVKALLKVCNTLLQQTSEKSIKGDWSKEQFPTLFYNKLKLWLETPDDSWKYQKLKDAFQKKINPANSNNQISYEHHTPNSNQPAAI